MKKLLYLSEKPSRRPFTGSYDPVLDERLKARFTELGLKGYNHDPSAKLCEAGLLEHVGFSYGSVYGITEAGLETLKAAQ